MMDDGVDGGAGDGGGKQGNGYNNLAQKHKKRLIGWILRGEKSKGTGNSVRAKEVSWGKHVAVIG